MAFDFGNAGTGALTGLGVGSAAGPLGAAGGSILGFLSGGLGFGKSKPEKIKQMQNFSPEQQALINELLPLAKQGNQNALKYLNSILSDEEGAYEDFERPIMDQFQQEVIPGILERFQGAGMSKGSSGLNQTLGQAAKGLSTNLAAQRAGLKQNAISSLQNYSNMGLTRQTTPYIKGGQPGAWSGLAPAAGAGISDLLSNLSNSQTAQNFMNNFRGGI